MKKTTFFKHLFKSLTTPLIIAGVLISSLNTRAQTFPDLLWSKSYPGVYTELARQVLSTSDGGFAIVGESESFGPGIISTLLIKCDTTGEMEWYKTYGGEAFDIGYGASQTKDNGFIIATYTTSFEPEGLNLRLIKTDANGNEEWASVVPNSNGCIVSFAGCVVQTEDGGYLLVGDTYKDGTVYNQIKIFKIDENGEYLWHKEIGGPSDDYGACIQPTIDGNYILASHTYSYGNGKCDGYLVKINPEGDIIWEKTYGGTSFDSFYFVRPTSDGGYIAVGSTQSYGKAEQGFIVKTDSEGETEWTAAHGGNKNEGFFGVVETPDHNYLVSGFTNSYGNGEHDCIIALINSAGELVEMKTYGGQNDDFGATIEEWPGKGYIAAGSFYSTSTYHDFTVLNFSPLTIPTATDYQPVVPEKTISIRNITPNPFYDEFLIEFSLEKTEKISITLTDMTGCVIGDVLTEALQQGIHRIPCSGRGLKPGVYICRIQSGSAMAMKKIVKLL